jgi:hypothetical protein
MTCRKDLARPVQDEPCKDDALLFAERQLADPAVSTRSCTVPRVPRPWAVPHRHRVGVRERTSTTAARGGARPSTLHSVSCTSPAAKGIECRSNQLLNWPISGADGPFFGSKGKHRSSNPRSRGHRFLTWPQEGGDVHPPMPQPLLDIALDGAAAARFPVPVRCRCWFNVSSSTPAHPLPSRGRHQATPRLLPARASFCARSGRPQPSGLHSAG